MKILNIKQIHNEFNDIIIYVTKNEFDLTPLLFDNIGMSDQTDKVKLIARFNRDDNLMASYILLTYEEKE